MDAGVKVRRRRARLGDATAGAIGMIEMAVWCELTIDVPTELAEAVAERLFDLGSPGLESADRDGQTTLIAYFRTAPSPDQLGQLLLSSDPRIAAAAQAIRLRYIEEENWGENWKRHFRRTPVGDRFVVCPPWEPLVSEDRHTIVIEPGMAFGTGQHPTTTGCLRMVEHALESTRVHWALDIGTGSGILAIALAKLGVDRTIAVDNDPTACEIAAANVRANQVQESVEVATNWPSYAGRFNLIVANLFTNLLRDSAPDILRSLAPGGRFICSGFLVPDEQIVTQAYADLSILRRIEEDGWVSLLFG